MQTSPLTTAILTALRDCNGEISWATLEAAAGQPLATIRTQIHRARLILERDSGIVFATIRGIGLRRLDDAEKVASTAEFRARIYRTAGHGTARLDAVQDMAALSPADQMTATINRTLFAAVRARTGEPADGK